jgi:hypothetical protein
MRKLRIRLRWLWRKIVRAEGSPQALGRGFAAGLIVGMSPFIGLHSILVLTLATIFRGNKLLGLATVWISNPLTFAPQFWVEYEIGSRILSIHQYPHKLTPLHQVISNIESPSGVGWFQAVLDHIEALLSLGWEVLGPIILGALVLGAALAVPGYFLMTYAVRLARRRRRARRHAFFMKPSNPENAPPSS